MSQGNIANGFALNFASQNGNARSNCRLFELCILGCNGQAVPHGQFQVNGVVAAELVAHGQFKQLALTRAGACIYFDRQGGQGV